MLSRSCTLKPGRKTIGYPGDFGGPEYFEVLRGEKKSHSKILGTI